MLKTFNYIMLLFCFTMPGKISAQKAFVEGVIIYNVVLQPANTSNANTIESHKGTYTITVKGKQTRKEFKLDNDFDNTILLNGDANTAYSLKISQGRKYAIQLDPQELIDHAAKYHDFHMDDEGSNITKVAGLQTRKAKISYKGGSSVNILYTRDWEPANKNLFDHFPDFDSLPLDFTYITENGATVHFHAEKIESTVVENSMFKVPKDYRIISKNEYRELSKQ